MAKLNHLDVLLITTLTTLESKLLFSLSSTVFSCRLLLSTVVVFHDSLPETLAKTVEEFIAFFKLECVSIFAEEVSKLNSHVI